MKQEVKLLNAQRKILRTGCMALRAVLRGPGGSNKAEQLTELSSALRRIYKSSLIANIEANQTIAEEAELLVGDYLGELPGLVKANSRLLETCLLAINLMDEARHHLQGNK
ncbi:hypothetical protein [Bradyrhizobium australiense]|uniref:Uncharacterized protein n=1 Tax=Bradyrhizobium australiense TaxID=2721161 RepID=A0A7Y4GXJ8_9BRAD|nr:hypothetical protein [Bradyrhizobium australiense]NOJ43522.1 hypothetical protein [Bradyrhizobium australiense]